MVSQDELIFILNQKVSEHNELKRKIKCDQRYASRPQILIWRRAKRKIWKEIRELQTKIQLMQK